MIESSTGSSGDSTPNNNALKSAWRKAVKITIRELLAHYEGYDPDHELSENDLVRVFLHIRHNRSKHPALEVLSEVMGDDDNAMAVIEALDGAGFKIIPPAAEMSAKPISAPLSDPIEEVYTYTPKECPSHNFDDGVCFLCGQKK